MPLLEPYDGSSTRTSLNGFSLPQTVKPFSPACGVVTHVMVSLLSLTLMGVLILNLVPFLMLEMGSSLCANPPRLS